MTQNRIYVIGASGTGKATFAKALAQRIGVPPFDSDDHFHFQTDPPYQKQRSPDERIRSLMSELEPHSSWVLSGGAGVWKPMPPLGYSVIVFLYLPQEVRLQRLAVREQQLNGARIKPGGDMYSAHEEFMAWTAGYDSGTSSGTCTLARHLNLLKTSNAPTIRFETPMTTQDQLLQFLRAQNEKTRPV